MCESGTDFVPLTEAAQLLETTEAEVLQMLNINKLQGKLVDAAWYVDRSSLDLCDKPKVANSDERQLLLPVNDNYNSRFITSLENSTLRVLERQRKQKEPVGRLAFPLPRKHFTYATS